MLLNMKFKDMSKEQQAAYLKAHPNSKFGKTKSVKWAGQSRSAKMRVKAFDSYFWANNKTR